MPIYTYECEECGVRFDARQRFMEDPIAICPECGSHTHRVPQAVGIVFKGSGWYVTDSKGRNNLAVPPKKENDAGDAKSVKPDKPDTSSTPSSPADSSAKN